MANILVVEDNASLRLAYVGMLQQAGHEVAESIGADEALEYLAKNTPDLLLVDMLMPRKTGLELLQAYDVKNKHPEVKVIAFSNLSETWIEQEARKLGANLFLTKSLTSPEELIQKIDGLLSIK